MTPGFEIRLSSMIKALEQVVLPAVEPGNGFATEQLAITIGQLEMLRLQWPYAHGYAERCLDDIVALGRSVAHHASSPTGDAVMDAVLLAGESDASSTDELIAQRDRIGNVICAAIEDIAIQGDEHKWRTVAKLVIEHEGLAHERNRAWFARTGMDPQSSEWPPIQTLVRQN